MTRTHARSLGGNRAVVKEPLKTGVNISVISALSLEGIFAPMTMEGPIDSIAFDNYVENFLVTELCPSDIVILDNVAFHYSERAISLIKEARAIVEFLPAYSPDFNPIEECISKLKAILKKAKARTKLKLLNALRFAMDHVSSSDIIGWFTHSGYICA